MRPRCFSHRITLSYAAVVYRLWVCLLRGVVSNQMNEWSHARARKRAIMPNCIYMRSKRRHRNIHWMIGEHELVRARQSANTQQTQRRRERERDKSLSNVRYIKVSTQNESIYCMVINVHCEIRKMWFA